MTNKEIKEKIEKAYNEYENEYEYIGLRFENKDREIGDICENSKHNPNRDDSRDFPEYDSEEYEKLPEFEGTSAWDLNLKDMHRTWFGEYMEDDEESYYPEEYNHAYIIAGNEVDNHIDRDYDEVIIKDAEVVEIIF